MNIQISNENIRKTIYDIANIFYCKEEIKFISPGDLIVGENKIIYKDEVFEFSNNYELKINLYKIFSKETSYKSPWGILTGSKPSKLMKKYSAREISEKFLLSKEKTDILSQIKSLQDKIFFNPEAFNLYINIPFCPSRCYYCSYPTIVGGEKYKKDYIEALIREINSVNLPRKLDTIYIGGGTPSYLSNKYLERLLKAIKEKYEFLEFSFEAGRIDTLNVEKLRIMKSYGVGRISINPQTFSKDVGGKLNRFYDREKIIELVKISQDMGFVVNMDFIIGLLGENRKTFRENFKILENLLPDNLTFHALAIKQGSKYRENNIQTSREEALKISQDVYEFSKKFSYQPYYLYRQKNIISNLENIGYEKNNTYSRYNIIINDELENVVGLGMNANSKLKNGKKFRNSRNIRDYFNNFDQEISRKNKLINSYINSL